MQAVQPPEPQAKRERESIHSGQFMVSTFEAEEQDDEDDLAVPIPEEPEAITTVVPVRVPNFTINTVCPTTGQLMIDTSLAKLFQCMSIAYRQKLTSPKWNRFRGIKLRWKDKIRLNNVIWRCWHLQFIKKEKTLVCQFASPLDVDTHNKPEAVVLEGKYWKRKLAAVTAEYKKWRMFYRNHALGQTMKDDVEMLNDTDLLTWDSQSAENMHMMVDEDYMNLMSDTLFSTITNQPFVFPDSREIAKAGLADFIQPSLEPLQPNLDDYMDTFEPLQEFISQTCGHKLSTVPEEQSTATWNYSAELELISPNANLQLNNMQVGGHQFLQPMPKIVSSDQSTAVQTTDLFNVMLQPRPTTTEFAQTSITPPPPPYLPMQKQDLKPLKEIKNSTSNNLQGNIYSKPTLAQGFPGFTEQNMQQKMPLQDSSMQISQSQQYKIAPNESRQVTNVGYKFSPIATPNFKFTSHQVQMLQPPQSSQRHYNTPFQHIKEEKPESRVRNNTGRGRQRSRSNTREAIRRPPLISAASDPALLSQSNSVLLTQLLTNNTENDRRYRSNDQLNKQVWIKDEHSPIPILPQPPPPATTLIITTPVLSQSAAPEPLALNSFSASNSPTLDNAQSINSPTSSQGSIGSPNRDTRDQRRAGHIHAEQKRRYNIKNGFDMMHSLIPQLNQNPSSKLSKAAMLQKGAEYIRQLRSERNQITDEIECLKQQIESLNTSISNCQSMLPATGAPVSRRRDNKMQEMFDDYIRKRTMENFKYWIFSLLFRPVLESFNNFVSSSSLDELYRTTITWIEQHCTLVDLRPVVLQSLTYLSRKTDILSNPERLPEEARQKVLETQQSNTN